MAHLNIPDMPKVPLTVTRKIRDEMFLDWCNLLVELNPNGFLPIGVKKRWWHFKTEHPRTTYKELYESSTK